jgi:hypothetical protein
MVGKTALALALFGAFGGTSAMGNDASPNLALDSHYFTKTVSLIVEIKK